MREKKSGIRIIKHGKRVAVSFSATLQMNSCNDPGKAKIQSNNIYWASFSLLWEWPHFVKGRARENMGHHRYTNEGQTIWSSLGYYVYNCMQDIIEFAHQRGHVCILAITILCLWGCVCVCVCVWESEREREKENDYLSVHRQVRCSSFNTLQLWYDSL